MKLIAVATLIAPMASAAEPAWRAEFPLRAVGSIELDAAAPHQRDAIVPAFALRIGRRIARGIYLGGTFGGGLPAWYGKTELAASADAEHVLAEPRCEVVSEGAHDLGHRVCRGARWTVSAGLDAGLGLYYADAPPLTPPSSDALIYAGPLVRARVQLHILDVLANGRAIGVAFGASVAATSAHYMSTADGHGRRLEPELEVALTTRL